MALFTEPTAHRINKMSAHAATHSGTNGPFATLTFTLTNVSGQHGEFTVYGDANQHERFAAIAAAINAAFAEPVEQATEGAV